MKTSGVQPVEEKAYEAVVLLGKKGGWEGIIPIVRKVRKANADFGSGEERVDSEVVQDIGKRKKPSRSRKKSKVDDQEQEQAKPIVSAAMVEGEAEDGEKASGKGRKRKVKAVKQEQAEQKQVGERRSKRNKK